MPCSCSAVLPASLRAVKFAPRCLEPMRDIGPFPRERSRAHEEREVAARRERCPYLLARRRDVAAHRVELAPRRDLVPPRGEEVERVVDPRQLKTSSERATGAASVLVDSTEALDDIEVIGPWKIDGPAVPSEKALDQIWIASMLLQHIADRCRWELGNAQEP